MKFHKLINLAFELINIPSTTNRHFSFLTIRNHIISIGTSQLKTHPKAKKGKYQWEMIHSELDCLNRSPLRLNELGRTKLFNVRVNTKGEICNSRPCETCFDILFSLPIKEIWFTNKEGIFEKL